MFLFIVAILFAPSSTFGSPHPAMGSSTFMQMYKNQIRSQYGFTLSSAGTNWRIRLPNRRKSLNYRVFEGPERERSTPTLSVRFEELKRKSKLKTYVKKWVREYPYYGFKILGSKMFKHQGTRAFVIDILSEAKSHRLRQAIFVKNKKAVILTCSDHQLGFSKTLKDCNEIIKTFSWDEIDRHTEH